jgi:alpha-mannosidase
VGKIPKWVRASEPPQELAGRLMVLPGCCEASLPTDWLEQAEAAGACVVRPPKHRRQLVEALLGHLETDTSRLEAPLVEDFFALGFCYLQVELLTRQLRYMSNLDEYRFSTEAVAAAAKAVAPSTCWAKPASTSIPSRPTCST